MNNIAIPTQTMHMLFVINNDKYSVPIHNVVEILQFCNLQTSPNLSSSVIGMLDYKNLMIPVLDIRKILSVDERNCSITQKILILKEEENLFAIVVDKILNIEELQPQQLQQLPYKENSCVHFIYKSQEDMVSILDVNLVKEYSQQQNDTSSSSTSLILNETDLPIALERALKIKSKTESIILYENSVKYLIFALGNIKFCVDITKIEKVIDTTSVVVTPLPNKTDYIEGIANFRGSFLTIINFDKFISHTSDENIAYENKKIIVLAIEDFKVGFLVDKIFEILPISQDKLIENNEYTSVYPFVHYQIVKNDEIYFIIDVESLLKDDRMYINE